MKTEVVYLIYGGPGGEAEVSRVSALGIFQNIDRHRWRVAPIGITADCAWYLQSEPAPGADRMPLEAGPDHQVWVVPGGGLRTRDHELEKGRLLPIVHGSFGEDGRLQGLLEWTGWPYAGARVAGSALGMDKDLVKRVWQHAGLPVVDWHLVRRHDPASVQNAVMQDAVSQWGWPLFVKPANSGSSVGVSKAADPESFEQALLTAFRVDGKVLVEPALSVREIECAVLETSHGPQTFPLGEIVPSHEFYDYEAKYADPEGARLVIPAQLDHTVTVTIRDLAVKAFILAEARGFARVDFFIDRTTGGVFLNEINTLPGFTPISMYPRMAQAGGVSYARLLDLILESAL